MRTISVQSQPNGFEIETPSLSYWFKAGAGFALGAGTVFVVAGAFYVFFVLPVLLRAMLGVRP